MRTSMLLLLVIAICVGGCSSNGNPVAPSGDGGARDDVSSLIPGVIGLSDTGDIYSAIGMMGAYELTIDPDDLTANLVAKRVGTIGESYIVSGIAFFTVSPCADCFKIKSLEMDDDWNLIVTFYIEHPFQPGDPLKPPTAVNRLDLDIFDLSLVIQPLDSTPTSFSLTTKSIYSGICPDADGYTSELSNLTGDTSAMPYYLVVDDSETGGSTWNEFSMGASQTFEAKFSLSGNLMFNLYLAMGYGASAKKPQRLIPKYYNPEFNKKPAWKIEVIPPGAEVGFTWQEDDNTTTYDVEVRVYDWQQDALIYADPDDFANAPSDNIYASSNVSSVSVEIDGMTSTLPWSDSPVSGAGTPDNPLIYRIPIANENFREAGQYAGLVKVTDDRMPSLDWMLEPRDFIIDSPDGIVLNNYLISEYVTYQVFTATVVEEPWIPPGPVQWAKKIVGPNDDQSFAITALSDDSTVVTGYFRSSVIFAQGESNETPLTSAGENDMFIARYDPAGALQWVKRVGAAGWETGWSIASLSDDSVVTTGIFGWTVVFGQGEPNQTTLNNFPNDGVYVARYNPNGTLAWAKSISCSGNGRAYGMGIASFSDDSSVATGWLAGPYVFGSGEPNQITLTNGAGYNGFNYRDIWVAKYNPNGTLAWAKRAGGSAARNDGIAATTLLDGTSVVTGYFMGTAVFGQGESNQTTLVSNAGVEDIFVAKYNTNGILLWAKRAGSSTADLGQSITTLSDGTTVVTGYFTGSAVFGQGEPNETTLTSAGGSEIYIARYNTDGTLIWAKSASGVNGDYGYSVAALPTDTIVLTGYFTGEVTFGQGEPNEKTLITSNGTDVFIAWYNPDGTILWAKHVATGEQNTTGRGITVLSDDSTVVTGTYRSPLTVGPGDPNETLLSWVATYDAFIARFAP